MISGRRDLSPGNFRTQGQQAIEAENRVVKIAFATAILESSVFVLLALEKWRTSSADSPRSFGASRATCNISRRMLIAGTACGTIPPKPIWSCAFQRSQSSLYKSGPHRNRRNAIAFQKDQGCTDRSPFVPI